MTSMNEKQYRYLSLLLAEKQREANRIANDIADLEFLMAQLRGGRAGVGSSQADRLAAIGRHPSHSPFAKQST